MLWLLNTCLEVLNACGNELRLFVRRGIFLLLQLGATRPEISAANNKLVLYQLCANAAFCYAVLCEQQRISLVNGCACKRICPDKVGSLKDYIPILKHVNKSKFLTWL